MTTMDSTRDVGSQPDPVGSRRRRRRRWLTAGAGVVLAGGAICGPFLLHDGHATTPPEVPPGAISADVDGDGRADVVRLTQADDLRVALGGGGTVVRLLQDQPRLEGVADVHGIGMAVVVSHATEGHAREWTAWSVRGHHLVALRFRHRAVIADEPGSATAWLAGHRLYDGALDPLQAGSDRVVVVAHAWVLRDGLLTARNAGLRCWDQGADAAPAACSPDQDWSYDVGQHGDLPALLPAVRPARADHVRTGFGDVAWRLRDMDPTADPESATYDLVRLARGDATRVQVPTGWAPRLFREPVSLGDGVEGVVLSQEGGDSDTWRVYAAPAGRLQQLATQGPVPLGGGFTSGGDAAYLSWMTPQGRLFSRIGGEQPGHFHVYAWQPTGGDAAGGPVLRAVDLGTVCIDETLDTYGTCR